jgi:lipopolysaccharide export system protein LptA
MPALKQVHFGLVCVLLLFSGSALALSSDKDEPIEIEADTAELDDKKRITIYRGDVIVTQGTLLMKGDVFTVYYDEERELDYATMDGNLAYYRQLPDNSEVYDEAWARRMEYYEEKGQVILIRDAKVVQDGLEFTGERIEYDTINSRVVAHGRTRTVLDAEEDKPAEDGRVRIILTPRKQSSE